MIKLIRVFGFLFLFSLMSGTTLLAQKFGHINSGNLISEMAATKKAEKELKNYQKMLVAETDKVQVRLDQKAKNFEAKYMEGNMSKLAGEERYASLQKEQEMIFSRRKQDEEKVMTKRNELVKPIFDKVEKAIQQVGKEGGYMFVFDTSLFNSVLHAEDSEDVTGAVKKKLGL